MEIIEEWYQSSLSMLRTQWSPMWQLSWLLHFGSKQIQSHV
jgi:hypothetical protein